MRPTVADKCCKVSDRRDRMWNPIQFSCLLGPQTQIKTLATTISIEVQRLGFEVIFDIENPTNETTSLRQPTITQSQISV
jgi:hypothetical protein